MLPVPTQHTCLVYAKGIAVPLLVCLAPPLAVLLGHRGQFSVAVVPSRSKKHFAMFLLVLRGRAELVAWMQFPLINQCGDFLPVSG